MNLIWTKLLRLLLMLLLGPKNPRSASPYIYDSGVCHHCIFRPWWRHQTKTFSALLALCAVNSQHQGQWRGALMFFLIGARTNGWVNNGEGGDLRRHRAHYDVIVIRICKYSGWFTCLVKVNYRKIRELRTYNHTFALATRYTWWRHQMETFSASLAFCARNSPVTGEFPSQRTVTRSFDVFFDLRLNRHLNKQSIRSHLRHPAAHYDVTVMDADFENIESHTCWSIVRAIDVLASSLLTWIMPLEYHNWLLIWLLWTQLMRCQANFRTNLRSCPNQPVYVLGSTY